MEIALTALAPWLTASGSRASREHTRRFLARIAVTGSVFAGCTAVYLSSSHLAQYAHGAVVLPWQFPPATIAAFVASGLLLSMGIVLQPAGYWSTLVFATTASAGMFVLRFSIFDEWLALCIAGGGMIACATGRVPRRRRTRHVGWVQVFLGLAAYYFLESVLGYVLYGNIKALRYSIISVSVFIICWTMARYELPRPDGRQVTVLIVVSALSYYGLIILHAAVFPAYAYEITLEGIGNAGSTDLCVVGIVAMPAAMILIGCDRGWRRFCGILALFLGLLIAALGDARGGMLCVAGAVVAAPFALGLGRSIGLWVTSIVTMVVIGTVAFDRPEWPLDMLGAIGSAADLSGGAIETAYFGDLVVHARGDAGRMYYVRGAVRALAGSGPRVALLGAGTYGYFPVAGAFYELEARENGIPTTSINLGAALAGTAAEPPRPPALGLLIAETGLVGILLLVILMVFSLKAVLARRTKHGTTGIALRSNVLVVVALMIAAGWTYFGDAPATIFFYLLIMPYGIADTWSRVDIEYARSWPRNLIRPPARMVGE